MNRKLKISLLLLALALMALVAASFFYNSKNYFRAKINGIELKLELANDPNELSKGLSGRESLGQFEGMLFKFDSYSKPGFWMKEMNFPLDIIWIKDKTILGASENTPVSAEAYPPSYYPQEEINYVLEVNAGFMEKHGIKPGDVIIYK